MHNASQNDPLQNDPLQVAPDFRLPDDADARRLTILGMSGSGKSSVGKVVVKVAIGDDLWTRVYLAGERPTTITALRGCVGVQWHGRLAHG